VVALGAALTESLLRLNVSTYRERTPATTLLGGPEENIGIGGGAAADVGGGGGGSAATGGGFPSSTHILSFSSK
jgi:hypothetical protein